MVSLKIITHIVHIGAYFLRHFKLKFSKKIYLISIFSIQLLIIKNEKNINIEINSKKIACKFKNVHPPPFVYTKYLVCKLFLLQNCNQSSLEFNKF